MKIIQSKETNTKTDGIVKFLNKEETSAKDKLKFTKFEGKSKQIEVVGNKIYVGIDGAENAFLLNQENTILKIGTNNAIQMYFNTDGKIGIGTDTPSQKLEVGGKVKIGDDTNTPYAGTIRWNSTTNDFEGYTGT